MRILKLYYFNFLVITYSFYLHDFFFWLQKVFSTFSPHSYHPTHICHTHITCNQAFPALLECSATFHLREIRNSFLTHLVYTTYYYSLSVRLGTDKNPNGLLTHLKMWLSKSGTSPGSCQQIMPWCHRVTRTTLLGFWHNIILVYKDGECKASIYREFLVN